GHHASVLVFCTPHPHLRAAHSFPTRRSSDLGGVPGEALNGAARAVGERAPEARIIENPFQVMRQRRPVGRTEVERRVAERLAVRSEEHTSELQSRVDLVCRLLLEKKKR